MLVFASLLRAQDPVQVHGYIQGRFSNEEGTPDRLEIRRARLIFSGDPVPGLSYRFQVDFVKRPYLMDASLAWKFSRSLTVSAGQMKVPFSAESLISDNLNAPVSRSRAVLSLAPGRDTGVQGRDTGAMASGSFSRSADTQVEYAVGVFRGQTLIESPKIHYNASAGRLLVHLQHGLSLGGDWYGSFTAPAHLEKRREAVEGAYDRGPLHLRAEQIWARDGTLQRRGGYLLGWWRVSPGWETLARADWLTTDVRKTNASSVAYVVGANRYLWNHAKIGLNAGAQDDQGPRAWTSVFFAQIMLFY
jgi:hypothetical protein